jgi:hypothetical protein
VLNNYNGKPGRIVTALQGIKDHAGAAVEVVHDGGCDVVGVGRVATKIDNEEGFSSGASVKLDARAVGEFIEFAVPVPETGEYELKLDYKSFPSRGVYQLSIDGAPQGQPVDMYEARDRYGRSASLGTRLLEAGVRTVRFTLNGKNAASAGFSGHFDKLTLVGKHTLTCECESLKAATGGPGERGSIARAAELARGADVAVVCIGTDARVEHESRDRRQLGLPGAQEELVRAVLAANPRTIVVQMSAGPLTVPWSKEHVPAMLQAWWPGEEGGRALADVLFGEVNPAGRLPHTVYASEAQVPPQDEYDISTGYTYMYVKGEPLYPFGHGLSYTAFEYADLRTSGPPLTVTPPWKTPAAARAMKSRSSISCRRRPTLHARGSCCADSSAFPCERANRNRCVSPCRMRSLPFETPQRSDSKYNTASGACGLVPRRQISVFRRKSCRENALSN